jgi:hypothetical protein
MPDLHKSRDFKLLRQAIISSVGICHSMSINPIELLSRKTLTTRRDARMIVFVGLASISVKH